MTIHSLFIFRFPKFPLQIYKAASWQPVKNKNTKPHYYGRKKQEPKQKPDGFNLMIWVTRGSQTVGRSSAKLANSWPVYAIDGKQLGNVTRVGCWRRPEHWVGTQLNIGSVSLSNTKRLLTGCLHSFMRGVGFTNVCKFYVFFCLFGIRS